MSGAVAGRDLDVRIAVDVMGLLVCDSPAALELPEVCSLHGQRHFSRDGHDTDSDEELPHYSTDMNAAMLVVGQLMESASFVDLTIMHESAYGCRVNRSDCNIAIVEDCESLPLAICIAALAVARRDA